MKHIIYLGARILKIVDCVEADAAMNCAEGESFIAAPDGVSDATHYIQDGVIQAMPVKPSPFYVFDYSLTQWVDPRSLQNLKEEAWARIKAAREAAIDANLVTPYGTFDCKAKDRTNITDAVLLLQTLAAVGTPTNIDFTLSDNSTVSLTTTEMVTVGLLLGQKVQAAHAQARTLRAQIDAANSSTELEAIVWV